MVDEKDVSEESADVATEKVAEESVSNDVAAEAGASDSPTEAESALPEVDDVIRPEDLADDDDEDEEEDEDASPIEEMLEEVEESDAEQGQMDWFILKVQVNRESSICDALQRRVKVAGLDEYFGDILVPTEDVREFTKSGKQRIVKRKLYPGYVVVNMVINDDTWFLVRETPGIGDFTGAAGKPAPLSQTEIDRIIATTRPDPEQKSEEGVKTAIKFKVGDRVRVKEGYFQNYEGEVSTVDERNGRVTVMINIFGRPNPVELNHWQIEDV